jgi:hypothetical protein
MGIPRADAKRPHRAVQRETAAIDRVLSLQGEVVPVRESAVNFECVISKIGQDYYWASRENRPMVRIEAGAFITFVALDGAGYVRMVAPGEKKTVSLMGDTEAKFDYVEHLLIGLKSVTYYGTLR